MWYAIFAAAWWLSAFLPLIFMSEQGIRDIGSMTWGGLIVTAMVSCVGGPILGLCIVLAVVVQLDFWDKPIWPRKK